MEQGTGMRPGNRAGWMEHEHGMGRTAEIPENCDVCL